MSIQKACEMAGEWWAARLNEVYATKREEFAKRVTALCLEEFTKQQANNHRKSKLYLYTSVDYDPEGLLLVAVRELIDPNCRGVFFSARGILPEKHSLHIMEDKLWPKEGYGNFTAEIFVSNQGE